MKDEDWDQTIATNLSGSFYCARAAARMMIKQRSGRIINISSIVGEMGNAGQASYVASKAGLIGLTKSMARELGSRGVTVNAVTPGFIETEMTDALSENVKKETPIRCPPGSIRKSRRGGAFSCFSCRRSGKLHNWSDYWDKRRNVHVMYGWKNLIICRW